MSSIAVLTTAARAATAALEAYDQDPRRVRPMLVWLARTLDEQVKLLKAAQEKPPVVMDDEKTPLPHEVRDPPSAHESSSKFNADDVKRLLAEGRKPVTRIIGEPRRK